MKKTGPRDGPHGAMIATMMSRGLDGDRAAVTRPTAER